MYLIRDNDLRSASGQGRFNESGEERFETRASSASFRSGETGIYFGVLINLWLMSEKHFSGVRRRKLADANAESVVVVVHRLTGCG